MRYPWPKHDSTRKWLLKPALAGVGLLILCVLLGIWIL
jgi:hypothetical protein